MSAKQPDESNAEITDGNGSNADEIVSAEAVDDRTDAGLAHPDNSTADSPDVQTYAGVDAGRSPSVGKERLRASGYFSWFVVIGMTLMMVGMTTLAQFSEHEPGETSKADLMQINLQAKVLMGQKGLAEVIEPPAPTSEDPETADEAESSGDASGDQANAMTDSNAGEKNAGEANSGEANSGEANSGEANSGETDSAETAADSKQEDGDDAPVTIPVPEALDDGTYEQRLCYAIILSELYGPSKAIEYLKELEAKVADANFVPNESQQTLRGTVEKLVSSYDQGDFTQTAVDDAAKNELQERLGFCGQLLLSPEQGPDSDQRDALLAKANQTTFSLVGGLIFAILVFLAGIVCACVILALLLDPKGRSPVKFQTNFDATNIYIETFAIWMLIFFGVQFGIAGSGLITDPKIAIFFNVGVFFFSLIALGWPVVRGYSLRRVFSDIGLTGRGLFKDIAIGFATYAAWLPMVLVAFFFVFVLMNVVPVAQDVGEFELPPSPGHPVQQLLADGDATIWLGVVLAACVAAPIVEETMFRGVLYRHLRELSADKKRLVSVGISSVLNGLVFAAIHPQGVMAIPLLTMLAVGFSLTREWRNSLVSSITMHAINNGLVTGFMFLIL